jgi:hypothetical protein
VTELVNTLNFKTFNIIYVVWLKMNGVCGGVGCHTVEVLAIILWRCRLSYCGGVGYSTVEV